MSSESMARDDWQELEDELEETEPGTLESPPAWNPDEEGERVMGEVVHIERGAPSPHGPCDVVTLSTPDGEPMALWLSHVVLREKWEEKQPEVGDKVAVRFDGFTENSNGREYRLYSLVVERTDSDETNLDDEELVPF